VLESGCGRSIEVLETSRAVSTSAAERSTRRSALRWRTSRGPTSRLIYHEALTGAAHLVPARVAPGDLPRALGEMKREFGSPWARTSTAGGGDVGAADRGLFAVARWSASCSAKTARAATVERRPVLRKLAR
jgi:hypothetical protein